MQHFARNFVCNWFTVVNSGQKVQHCAQQQAILWRGYQTNINHNGEAKSCCCYCFSFVFWRDRGTKGSQQKYLGARLGCKEVGMWVSNCIMKEVAIACNVARSCYAVQLLLSVLLLHHCVQYCAQQFQSWTHGAVDIERNVASSVRSLRV